MAFLIPQAPGGVTMAVATEIPIIATGSKLIIASYVSHMIFWGFILAENTRMALRFGRAMRQTDRAVLVAPELGGLVPAGQMSRGPPQAGVVSGAGDGDAQHVTMMGANGLVP
jgi:hypothetical protein